jgi:hypothetical protein
MASPSRIFAGIFALLWLATQIARADDGAIVPALGVSSYTGTAGQETIAPADSGAIFPASSDSSEDEAAFNAVPESGTPAVRVAQPPLADGPSSDPGDGERWLRTFSAASSAPKWSVNVGALILERSNPQPAQIIHPIGSTATISNASDFSFNSVSAAPDITVFRRLRWGGRLQFRYFGGFDWTTGANYGAVGNVQIGSEPNFGATGLTGTYVSQLSSNFELNWVRPLGDRIAFLTGFRTLQVNEVLNYHITFPAFNADYTWKEANQLYGGQFGCLAELWRLNSRLSVTGTFKGGIYGNSASNVYSLVTSTGAFIPGGAVGSQTSFVGELGLNAAFRLTPHLSLYGGYQVMWVDGLALATDQAAAATANRTQNAITTAGDLFYFGARTGLRFTW